MKLSEVKEKLQTIENLNFVLPNGEMVPRHFHVTEVGAVQKHFIDCGGTVRLENKINFQLWEANDYDHRLAPQKLLSIIELSEKILGITNHEVEVEYQSGTIGKFGLEFENGYFVLTNQTTNCLAQDKCGIPESKPKVKLADLTGNTNTSCTPGSGCC
jgi:hypothetical protein